MLDIYHQHLLSSSSSNRGTSSMISSLLEGTASNNMASTAERNNVDRSPLTSSATDEFVSTDNPSVHNSSRRSYHHHSSDSSSGSVTSSRSPSPMHWGDKQEDRHHANRKSPTGSPTTYCSSPELQQHHQHMMMSSSAAFAAALRHPLHPAAALQMQTLQHNLRHLHHGLQGFHHSFGSSSSDSPTTKVSSNTQQEDSSSETNHQPKSPASITPASPKVTNVETTNNSPISATPHGIEHILSRPLPVRSAGTGIIGSPAAPAAPFTASPSHHLSPSFPHQPPAPSPLNFSPGIAGLPPSSLAGVYWPALPGFMGSPALQAWRDRLTSAAGKDQFFRSN